MHCVIGSGPAGVACAKALLARGADVHMLDAGIELEPGRAEIVRRFAAAQPAAWDPVQAAGLKSGLDADTTGIPLKLVFGSDFPYRETEEKIPWRGNGVRRTGKIHLAALRIKITGHHAGGVGIIIFVGLQSAPDINQLALQSR
ncbi:MAG TPA: hypothetical protein VMD27_07400, partial [Candidatus Aquilonibacter sp.]|nr:hypothetical protein [Candidatus Aquilonibacter sp.]